MFSQLSECLEARATLFTTQGVTEPGLKRHNWAAQAQAQAQAS